MATKVITNNVPRDIVHAYELTEKEQKDFDYLDWEKIEAGEDDASFVRYKGEIYDLGEFTFMPTVFTEWDGVHQDSFFSGILVRHVSPDFEQVIMGRYYS